MQYNGVDVVMGYIRGAKKGRNMGKCLNLQYDSVKNVVCLIRLIS